MLAAWLVAWGGFRFARNSKPTAERLICYLQSADLSQLSGSDRARALKQLADRLNALPSAERRKARMDREWNRWFAQMTEPEKGDFIEATMPTGFKQMLTAFEQMPEDKRKRAIDDACKRLQQNREALATEEPGLSKPTTATNASPELSKELQEKIVRIGLGSFYSQSSAQTKAELAPLLEEMQRAMESGRMFRGGR